MAEDPDIAARVRRLSGVPKSRGPDDAHLLAAVNGFVEAFNYWYIRVMQAAVPKYRQLVIARINPFVRRIQCEGMSPAQTASRLIEDYDQRNFVTAGGWALEEMASSIGEGCQKSSAEGVDIQRHDPKTGEYHLYVVKSGVVTRNSDIVNSLKKHSRAAEKLLQQGRATKRVHMNYAIFAGKTSSTYEDGIKRPSSAEFWGEIMSLPEREAIEVALSVAAEAGRLVRRDASLHVGALKALVADYIEDRGRGGHVDWDFIARRTMRAPDDWRAEDRERHERAIMLLKSSGYIIPDRGDDGPTVAE